VGFREVVEDGGDWQIVRNGAGALLKWWKTRAGTPEHIDFSMTSREVWDSDYREHLGPANDRRRIASDLTPFREQLAARRADGRFAYFGSQFIWENMRASLGDCCLYISMLEDPAWIHDIGRVYTDLYKRCFRILFDEVGVPDGVWLYEDLGYRDRLFVNPELYRDLVFPYYTEMVEFFHGFDLPVVLHTCGYTEAALDLVVDAGFEGLHPLEVKAGNDILKVAERYGDRLCFIGGLDARILERGDRREVRTSIEVLVSELKARNARWLFGSDHSLSTNVKFDTYRHALDVYRECRAY
jgi:uroporphyrinogen decarboxylase